ncbi:hypothetical protein FPANT_6697 [Fusarium pseudoanthophilum]|uniref:Uncharacterized protein n=1 Tax=Fusarium pseudoanthophilum TaxID=48495 RepID=A0A8H5L865_9HYPO|nr:hypothetical protein FPANT_6697 [Fusarium pseudoanthophilum]
MEVEMSDSEHEVSSRNFRDAVVSGVYQISKPVMFNMAHFGSQSEAQLVRELKPVGVLDAYGNLIGVRFQNVVGDDEHVLAYSETAPNARIYQGSKDGFQLAIDTVYIEHPTSPIFCISVPVLDKRYMANIPAGRQKIEMQLRVVEGCLDSKECTHFKPRSTGSERAFIILPGPENQELFSKLKKGMSCIILEEVPWRSSDETSKLVRAKVA